MSLGNRNIVKEAVADAQRVRKAAESAAKNKLIEQLSPKIRKLVENEMQREDQDRVRRGEEGRGENPKWEEGVRHLPEGDASMKKDDEKDLQDEGLGLEAMFPTIAEMEDEDEMAMEVSEEMPQPGEEEEQAEAMIPTLGESDDKDEDDEEGNMDEEIQIDEEGLRKAYEGLMKTENALTETSVDWSPDVSKGFKDSYPSSEWETEESPPSDRGLEAKEKDGAWEEERPPKAQDYTVKEAIKKGLKENSELRRYVGYLEEQLESAKGVIKKLKEEITDVNLFNAKVLHVNEMLNKYGKRLTKEQKKNIINSIDEAASVREVKLVSETLSKAFKSTEKLSEGKRRSFGVASGYTQSGSPKQKVLRESVDNSARTVKYGRWKELSGLKK